MSKRKDPILTDLAADTDHILREAKDLWEDLRNARLFITGGTGFFGCWLLESFIEANRRFHLESQAVVLTRNEDDFRRRRPHLASDPAISFHKGDIRSFDFPPGRFTHVIHGATEANVKLNEEQPLVMVDVIVEGTRRALDFAAASSVKSFLFISSGAVYGRQPAAVTHMSETYTGAPDPVHALSAYGESKRLAEFLCATYSREGRVSAKIARCFCFFGPYLPLEAHYAVGNFIRDALRGDAVQVNGDGTPYRSYLYGADLAVWLWKILLKSEPGRPYNVGSEKRITVGDLALEVVRVLNPAIPVRIAQTAVPGIPPEQYVPSIQRAKEELSLRQTIDLADGLRRTAAWARREKRK